MDAQLRGVYERVRGGTGALPRGLSVAKLANAYAFLPPRQRQSPYSQLPAASSPKPRTLTEWLVVDSMQMSLALQ